MRMRGRAGSLLLLLLAGAPAGLVGQLSDARYSFPDTTVKPTPTSGYHVPRGLWLSSGVGYGSVDCGNSGCTMGAPSGNLEVGWAVGPKVLLGAAILGWTKADEIMRITMGSLGLRLRFYPDAAAGFFFAGGFGLGMIRFSAGPQGRGNPFTTTGYAFLGASDAIFASLPI